jgi:hypothetical protein
MPRSNPAMWATDTPTSSTADAVDAAEVPLDAALSHSRAALELYRQFPDDVGIITEAVQKLCVAEAALKLAMKTPRPRSPEQTVAKALAARLAKTERRRKALQRKVGVGDGPEPEPEPEPELEPARATSPAARRFGTPPRDLQLSPWSSTRGDEDADASESWLSQRALLRPDSAPDTAATSMLLAPPSPEDRLRRPLSRITPRSPSSSPSRRRLLDSREAELEAREGQVEQSRARAEEAQQQEEEQRQILAGLMAQVTKYQEAEAGLKAELRRAELLHVTQLIERWSAKKRHRTALEAVVAAATARVSALAAAVPDSEKAAPLRPPSHPAPQQEQEEEEEDPAHYAPVVCPAGKQPGQLMKVDTPEGKAVYVEIPKGAKAGAEFEAFIGPRHLACVRILLERTLCPCNALPHVSPCRRGVISLTIARCIAAQSTAREDTAWSALGRSTACCWAETLATRTAAAAAGGGGGAG